MVCSRLAQSTDQALPSCLCQGPAPPPVGVHTGIHVTRILHRSVTLGSRRRASSTGGGLTGWHVRRCAVVPRGWRVQGVRGATEQGENTYNALREARTRRPHRQALAPGRVHRPHPGECTAAEPCRVLRSCRLSHAFLRTAPLPACPALCKIAHAVSSGPGHLRAVAAHLPQRQRNERRRRQQTPHDYPLLREVACTARGYERAYVLRASDGDTRACGRR
jgi:hypothetical protein